MEAGQKGEARLPTEGKSQAVIREPRQRSSHCGSGSEDPESVSVRMWVLSLAMLRGGKSPALLQAAAWETDVAQILRGCGCGCGVDQQLQL